MRSSVTRSDLLRDFERLGVRRADVIMVHAALRKIGPFEGGAETLVRALLEAIGAEGTLVAYVDWDFGAQSESVDTVPVFDPRLSPAAPDCGVLAETIRTWPGALRSGNPDAGVAAIGKHATWLCASHPLNYGYGAGSPFAKLIEIGARVLLLGAPLDTITLLHHAEHVAGAQNKRIKRYTRRIREERGNVTPVEIEEFDTSDPVVAGMPDDHFRYIAERALKEGAGQRGTVGNAPAYLFEAAALHAVGVQWLEAWPS